MLFLVGGNGGSLVRGVFWGGRGCLHAFWLIALHFWVLLLLFVSVRLLSSIFGIGGVVLRWGRGNRGGEGMSCFPLPSDFDFSVVVLFVIILYIHPEQNTFIRIHPFVWHSISTYHRLWRWWRWTWRTWRIR